MEKKKENEDGSPDLLYMISLLVAYEVARCWPTLA